MLSTLVYNKRKQIVEAFPLVIPPYGSITDDYFKQLAKLTSATVFE